MTTTPTSGAADLPEARLFTKKPVTIAAIQWTGHNLREVITFTDGPPDTRTTHAGMAWETYTDLVARDGLKIYTLEGKMLASPGDWIIRGVKGELYPCKPDIFEATYSPAALAARQATAAQQGAAYAALSDAEIDRIVPALEPVSEDFPVEWALWKDRGRIRNELRAAHVQAPAPVHADASYESMNLAVMVLSDCGHSSNYKPLLERVAGRIDRHVERLLTAQQADIAMRAQAAPQPLPASQENELDTARLDWLDKNIFYREMPEWDAKHGHGSGYNMWVLFAPKVAQGSARKIIDAARAARAPADSVLEDAAFEAVRKKLCALPRYSFVLDDDGLIRRVQDRTGNWIAFDDAHELFDPVAVDAVRKQGAKHDNT